jgi:hypothetical protein
MLHLSISKTSRQLLRFDVRRFGDDVKELDRRTGAYLSFQKTWILVEIAQHRQSLEATVAF